MSHPEIKPTRRAGKPQARQLAARTAGKRTTATGVAVVRADGTFNNTAEDLRNDHHKRIGRVLDVALRAVQNALPGSEVRKPQAAEEGAELPPSHPRVLMLTDERSLVLQFVTTPRQARIKADLFDGEEVTHSWYCVVPSTNPDAGQNPSYDKFTQRKHLAEQFARGIKADLAS